jgi:hypothetical protein
MEEISMAQSKKPPCLLAPFVALWNLIAYIISITGRLIAILLGLAFLILGVILTITVVGAILGIPMAIFGLLVVVRGWW